MVKGLFFPSGSLFKLLTILMIFFAGGKSLSSQPSFNYFYRVYFLDKGEINPQDINIASLFSQRAVIRRTKNGNTNTDITDIPVNKSYLDQIAELGFRLHCTSRWMNTALFKTENQADTGILTSLPFVKEVKLVKDPGVKTLQHNKLEMKTDSGSEPSFDRPLTMLNALPVHNSGFTGENIEIAVLDAGFLNADNIESLEMLRNREGIKGTRDFVLNDKAVYNFHYHGTAVLSVLSGYDAGQLEGSAPGAGYWLLRTEDAETEFPAEEDYWAAGAEYADSSGADIISSSLGYCTFDDPSMNYKYSDLDGKTAFVTIAAGIAVSKGMIVVNSAGNERNSDWLHIIAPADGESVLAVGAVDGDKIISSFSSAGPSYDHRIKPDIVAQGVSVPVQIETGYLARADGTSFSCPVISGMCACVLQADPSARAGEIIKLIRSFSDRYLNPDSLYGYGIPDFTKIISKIQEEILPEPGNRALLFPNPFTDNLQILFDEMPGKLIVGIYNVSGRLIFEKNFGEYISRSVILAELPQMVEGIYFVRLKTISETITLKVIKTSN